MVLFALFSSSMITWLRNFAVNVNVLLASICCFLAFQVTQIGS